jgi:hypothetical protein
MRLAKLILTTAVLGLAAVSVAAQDAEAPPPEAAPQERRGLSDLEATVNQLLEEETSPTSPEPAEPEAGQAEATQEPEAEPTEATEPEAPDSEPAGTATPPTESGEAEGQPAEPTETADPEAPPTEAAPDTPAPPAPPLTRAEIAAVERTAERGRLLVAIARAGILATQDMLTRLSDPEGAGITGWIAEPQGNAMDVTFYAAAQDVPKAVYRATINGGRIVSREIFLGDDRPVLNPIQARMAAARAATEGLEHAACTDQPFNVLVVPPASADAPVDVYQTSAPARRGAFPLGGHFRSTVAADGTVAETRGFTNSCVEVELPPAAAGQPTRPVGITHLLDPMPTEVHVLLSQLMGRPLLVATGDPQRVWLVTGDRIAEVRP